MVFPLDYTAADAEDILSPGNYLLDAIDKNGDALGLSVALSVPAPRTAEAGRGPESRDLAAAT